MLQNVNQGLAHAVRGRTHVFVLRARDRTARKRPATISWPLARAVFARSFLRTRSVSTARRPELGGNLVAELLGQPRRFTR